MTPTKRVSMVQHTETELRWGVMYAANAAGKNKGRLATGSLHKNWVPSVFLAKTRDDAEEYCDWLGAMGLGPCRVVAVRVTYETARIMKELRTSKTADSR